MTRLNVLSEGPTEETFVRDVLAPYLATHGVYATSRSIETGRKKGRIYRGGLTTYAKAKRDIQRWLSQDSSAHVTTMLDFYALPSDFPGKEDAGGRPNPIDGVELIEAAVAEDICNPRLIPYIQLHEFEALLFADVDVTDGLLAPLCGGSHLEELRRIRAAHQTPEHINDRPETAPSKRIIKLYRGYNKPLYGSRALARVGMPTLLNQCPHFAGWVQKLIKLAC